MIKQVGLPREMDVYFRLITSMITEPIGLHSVLLPSQQVTTAFIKYKFKEDRWQIAVA